MGGLKELRSQQDTEFAFRVISSGKKMILDPEIIVYHDHPLKSIKASFLRSLGYSSNHAIVMRTNFGRLVSGSGSSSMITPSYVIREALLITGVTAYMELHQEARNRNIKVSLPEFIFIRFIGCKLGVFIGVIRGSMIRNVSYSKILNSHKKAYDLPPIGSIINDKVIQ